MRQTFVRRCHGRRGSRGLPRSASQNVAEGQSAFEAVTFYGRQKQLRRPLPLVGPAVHWQIDFLSALPPCRTCCFAPNICSSLPWWLGFTRAAGNRQIKYDRGEVRAAVGRGDVGRGRRPLIIRGAPIDDGSSLALGPRPRLQGCRRRWGRMACGHRGGRLVGRSAKVRFRNDGGDGTASVLYRRELADRYRHHRTFNHPNILSAHSFLQIQLADIDSPAAPCRASSFRVIFGLKERFNRSATSTSA